MVLESLGEPRSLQCIASRHDDMPAAAEEQASSLIAHYLDVQNTIHRAETITLNRKADFGRAASFAGFIPRVQGQLFKLEAAYTQFYTTKLPQIYLAGAKSMAGNKPYKLTPADAKVLQQIQRRGISDLNAAHASVVSDTRRFRSFARTSQEKTPEPGHLRTNKIDLTRTESVIQRHGIKAVKFSDGKRYTLGDYSSMSIKSNSNLAYNLGALNAAKQLGIEVVEVFDGPGCGWTRHDDSDGANGSLRTVQEAMAYPTAHPHCQRSFVGRPDLKKDDIKPGPSKATKAAIAAVALAGTAGGLTLLAKSDALAAAEKRLANAAFSGNTLAQFFIQRINEVKGLWIGDVIPGEVVSGNFPLNVKAALHAVPIGPETPLFRQVVNDVMREANQFSEGMNEVNTRVRAVIGAKANASRAELSLKFRTFSRFDKLLRENDLARDQLGQILQFEARQRRLNWIAVFSSKAQSGITGVWTKFGPRIRTDITDFFKGELTFTPTGIIKAITLKPFQQVRTGMRMLQDGSLAGHVSLVPQGIFRAIVEVDQYGKLVGNIRVIPKGPLKLRLEFGLPGFNAKAVGSIERAIGFREGLQEALGQAVKTISERRQVAERMAARALTDPAWAGRAREAEQAVQRSLGTLRQAQKRLEDFDNLRFNFENPSVRDLAHDLRQLELKRIVLDYHIIKMGPLDIAGQLKLPIRTILDALKSEENKLSLVKDSGGKFSGNFFVQAPLAVIRGVQEVAKDFKIVGDLRFSKLHTSLKTSVSLADMKLQSIATSMKIRGYNVFNIADIMSLKVSDVTQLIRNRVESSKNLLTSIGVLQPEQIAQAFEERLAKVVSEVPQFGAGKNRAEMVDRAIQVMDGQTAKKDDKDALRLLAGILPNDSEPVVEGKLWSLRAHLMTDQTDRQAFVEDLKAQLVSGHDPSQGLIHLPDGPLDILARLSRGDIRFLARKLLG